MLTFQYIARDSKTGEKVKADVQADSEQAAAKLVREAGLAPLEITLKEQSEGGLLGRFTNKVKAKDRILFARQLSTLINAGLPLIQSLRSVLDQTQSKPLKVIISHVIGDVEAGSTLSNALARHPKV